MHQDDVPTCQAALDDGADHVEVGVAGQHEKRRALRVQLRPHLLEERLVDPGAAESMGQRGKARTVGRLGRGGQEDQAHQPGEAPNPGRVGVDSRAAGVRSGVDETRASTTP